MNGKSQDKMLEVFYLIRDITDSIKAAQEEIRYIEMDTSITSIEKSSMLKQACNVRLNRFNKLYEVVKLLNEFLEADDVEDEKEN
jgi:hypothetical protein